MSADSTLDRAVETAAGLRAGSWESVEVLSILAVECRRRPDAGALLDRARAAAAGLKPGTWQSVRALALLHYAERELGT